MISVAIALVLVALVVALFFAPLEPAVQGAIVGGFFALIASQVALFVQRRLREQGEVICQLSAWNDGGDARPGEYRIFEARFYNKKDVSIALWDFKAEFSEFEGGEERVSLELRRAEAGRSFELEPLNLLSREAIYLDLVVVADGDDLQRVREANKAELVMTVVGGEELRKELPRWSDLH